MWIIGTIILLVVGGAVTAAIGWAPRATPGDPLWDTSKMGGTATGYAGTFAGFSLAATTFIAGLDTARTSPVFATTFGMMLIGFLILVGGTSIANSTPTAPQFEGTTMLSLALVVAHMCVSLGVAITWLALAPLIEAIGMSALADLFVWPLLIMTLGAGGWVALVAYRLTMANVRGCLAVLVVGLALPAVYRLLARSWPALWPASEAALHFAFVALGGAFLLFTLQMGLLVAHSNKAIQERLRRNGQRLVLAASQAHVAVMVLVWLAVAFPEFGVK
jgi:hypothetical protein